jgi:nicotinamidase-related amidase
MTPSAGAAPSWSRRALLLMDFQAAVCGPDGRLGAGSGASDHTASRGVLARVAQTLAKARETDDLIVHVRVGFDAVGLRRTNRGPAFERFASGGALDEDGPGAQFCPQAQPLTDELVVVKGAVSPFAGTGLDELLRAQGIAHLLLAGVATNFVVESAARHAGDAGYRVDVLEDLCAAHSEQMHRFAVERILPTFCVVTSSEAAYPDR